MNEYINEYIAERINYTVEEFNKMELIKVIKQYLIDKFGSIKESADFHTYHLEYIIRIGYVQITFMQEDERTYRRYFQIDLDKIWISNDYKYDFILELDILPTHTSEDIFKIFKEIFNSMQPFQPLSEDDTHN